MAARHSLNPFCCSAWLIGAAVAVLSCREAAPAGPDLRAPAIQASVGGQTGGVLRCHPLAYDSVTQTIGPTGGTFRVSKHTLTIPPGALTSQVSITVVAPSDSVNRLQFGPDGLVFKKPLDLTMSYANCDLSGFTRQIAYMNDSLQILEYEPSVDDVSGKKVTGLVTHFSTYSVAW